MSRSKAVAILEQIRDAGLKAGASYVEARSTERDRTSIALQNGRADKLYSGTSTGIGVRVLLDGAWGFASSNDLSPDSARKVLESALAGARASRQARAKPAEIAEVPATIQNFATTFEIDPRTIPIQTKIARLLELDKAGADRAADKLINRVLSYSDSLQRETLVNSFGSVIQTDYTRTNTSVTIFVADGAVRQKSYKNKAEPAGWEMMARLEPAEFTEEAANKAVALLSARKAPSGKFPVVFHPTITGLLTHEALGHNAEADHVMMGTSILEGKLGDAVASPLVTIIDDATIANSWGSYFYDSEGTPAARRTLIENGRLVGFMHNLETAAEMGVAPNGSGRAEDHSVSPIVRMSNTFIAPGSTPLKDMLAGIDLGVYLTGGRWGYVFCERGQFTCNAGGGNIIRGGELAEPIRDVSVAGLTLDTLANIDAVGDDFEMTMSGMCGKCGQSMPVNAGGPHVRVTELVVGGQEAA